MADVCNTCMLLQVEPEILLKGTFNTIKPNHPFTDGQIQKILIKCHQNGHHFEFFSTLQNLPHTTVDIPTKFHEV
jgi:hypothetical protein